MKFDVASDRKDYGIFKLDKAIAHPNPIVMFEKWMNEAIAAHVPEPTAMTLSTVSSAGHPSSRIVLFKGLQNDDLCFFTNYLSKKGVELAQNPYGALNFFWPEMERQINISGKVKKANHQLSDKYFASRPRKYQLGAWASEQSHELPSKIDLMKKFGLVSLRYLGKPVPRPPFWGGYQLAPQTIEFWQGRANRLHDRICFTKNDMEAWTLKRLSP